MVTDRDSWLHQNKEAPIEPDMPLVDAHHHLWDRPNSRYMPEELLRDIDGNNVEKTVFIECYSSYRRTGPPELMPLGETEFVREIARRSANGEFGKRFIAAGIIGHANLSLGKAVEKVLAAHIETGGSYFKGIRHSTCWDPDPQIDAYMRSPKELMADQQFREGFACLEKYHLSFDAWIYFHQLKELADLARAFPDVPIIVDHIGGLIHIGAYASNHDEVLHQWRHGIAEVAACPNVIMKLGGIGMTRTGFGWHERNIPPDSQELALAMSPYYMWCIEKFGPARCMFESNFPVDRVSHSYTAMWNAFKILTRGFSPAERHSLFKGTAERVYRLS